jgi:1D-myo-inositol-triphosphate 3-kinase
MREGQIKLPLESGTSILKRLDEEELEVYERLRSLDAEDPIHDFVPHLVGVVQEVDEDDEVKSSFLRISNLCYPFTRPKVIDVKLGIRTFLEHECENDSLRPDLYKKMLKEFPHEIQEHERDVQAVTKHRWMSVRDANSTTLRLGFRIDGVAGYDAAKKEALRLDFLRCRSMEDSITALRRIVEDVSSDALDETRWTSPAELARRFVERLNVLRSAFETSAFLKNSECIGSSVMHVIDHTGRVDVFWIDFAKVRPRNGSVISHRDVWTFGNHEDGVLLGLDNLIDAWTQVWPPSGNVSL